VLLLLLSVPFGLAAGLDFAALSVDRAAIERVYHEHRTGTKPPFEEAMPPALLARLVREDAKKEAVLARTYGVTITDAMVAAEVERINTTTRAPEILAEIKAALGHDPARFARAMARPNVVERALRSRFENDDALHAPQRQQAETARNELLAARTQGADAVKLFALLKQSHAGAVTETTWQLSARPEEKAAPAAGADDLAIKQRFGPQAQLLSPSQPGAERDRKFYFADLPEELQNVLRVQLRQAGDVSAVIEIPAGFLLFLAEEKTDATLSVASLSIPKRSYEEWLAAQPD
jgi:hypothetical protein